MVHPECIRGLARDRNADGVYMDKDYTYNVGWMTNKCLRHADTLFVSHGGWAYVRDVAYTLWVQERKYGYLGQVSEADILFAIDASRKSSHKQRYLVSAIDFDAKLQPGNMVIKVVQVVNREIGKQMVDKEAYTPVTNAPALSHYTSLSLIDEIVGVNGKGIVPGGVKNRSQRSHCYFVGEQPPNDGSAPNQFWKDGTDCVIERDTVALKEHYAVFATSNDTVLIKKTVEVRDILRVTMFGHHT